MGEVTHLRKEDAVAEERYLGGLRFLENMLERFRERKLDAFVFVAVESDRADVEIDTVVHRDYTAKSVLDGLAVCGAASIVIDEMKSRLTREFVAG